MWNSNWIGISTKLIGFKLKEIQQIDCCKLSHMAPNISTSWVTSNHQADSTFTRDPCIISKSDMQWWYTAFASLNVIGACCKVKNPVVSLWYALSHTTCQQFMKFGYVFDTDHDCHSKLLLVTWWRHQMQTFSALLALCAGNSPVPVNSPHKGQWCGALMFSLICARINDWLNNREAGDLRRHRGHYDVSVMTSCDPGPSQGKRDFHMGSSSLST